MFSPALLLTLALLQPVAEGPAPLDGERPVRSERAAPAAEQRATAWAQERRRLQLHTGLSGAFAGVMVLTGTLLLAIPDKCTSIDVCEGGLGRAIAGITLFPLAVIPISTGIYWGVRLHRHDRQRPGVVLRPRPGGFSLQF